MSPCIIGIGGAHSGAGKTEAACSILRSLTGWGAIKCTPTYLYSTVVADPYVLTQEGKDTARFLKAGACEALWVQATPEDIAETTEIACSRFSHLPGIIIEGNSAIEVLNPDIVIFIFDEPLRLKSSAGSVLRRANAIVHSTPEPPEGIPAAVRTFSRKESDALAQYVAGLVREKCSKK